MTDPIHRAAEIMDVPFVETSQFIGEAVRWLATDAPLTIEMQEDCSWRVNGTIVNDNLDLALVEALLEDTGE